MHKLCATILTILLGAHPLLAEGPVTRSAAREASRLAAEPARTADRPGWRAVRLLEPGRKIVVTTAEATLVGELVAVDDSTLAVRDTGGIEHVNVEDILMIESRIRRGSALAAVFGTLGGIWLGSGVAFGLAESSRCYDRCGGVALAMWSAIIGVPIAGGYGAWRSTSHLTEEIIYRRLPLQR